ncbi:MAG: hypothetical protein LBU73_05080, partial [Helicobacteraceae bacterium]|nr:hypothetical protein [Helicobacteraceae bacterium]
EAGALNPEARRQNYLHRYYEKYLAETERIKGADQLKFMKFKARKDWTHDERIAAGQIEDASIVIPRTVAEQQIQLLKANTIAKIAERFASGEAKDGWIQVPTDTAASGVYKYGALAGKYVSPEVWGQMGEMQGFHDFKSGAEKFLFPVVDHLKMNLTVKNPNTHIYNFLSNVVLSFIHGDWSANAGLMAAGKEEFLKWRDLASQHGLDSQLDYFEAMNIDRSQPLEKSSNWAVKIFKELYMTEDSNTGAFFRKAYNWEDKWFKLARFRKNALEMEEAKGSPLTKDELRAAANDANDAYVNYARPLPAGVRAADRGGVTPFLHYSFKATPTVAKAIAKHPFRFALLQLGLLGAGGSAWLGEDDTALRPAWAGSMEGGNMLGAKKWTRLPFGSYWWNSERVVPGMRMDILDVNFGFWGGAVQIFGEGETTLGYKINSEYDNNREIFAARMIEAGRTYLPGFFPAGRYGQEAIGIALGDARENRVTGKPWTVWELLARGAGIRQFDEMAEVASKEKAAKKRLNHFEKQYEEENIDKARMDIERENYFREIEEINGIKSEAREVPDQIKKEKKRGGGKNGDDFPKIDIKGEIAREIRKGIDK